MIDTIQTILAPLHGLPLWDAGKVMDMLWLQFGAKCDAPTEEDSSRQLGEYVLHVQSPWRLSGTAGVIAGRSDVYDPADPELGPETFHRDQPGHAVADVQLHRWVDASRLSPPLVQSIIVDRCGGFVLELQGEQALEVFPDSCAANESREEWRLFSANDKLPHFVYTNHGRS